MRLSTIQLGQVCLLFCFVPFALEVFLSRNEALFPIGLLLIFVNLGSMLLPTFVRFNEKLIAMKETNTEDA